ncbi:MAG: MATE family efflux transporter [Treponema sp.]|nr:MATE family efflux transporter [Candidatus Treponema caballi]
MKNKTPSLFHGKEFTAKLIKLTLPIAFQSLMLAAVAAADAFMLGRVEQNAMSAVSLATQIQFVQNMFVFSIVSVVAILGAQYWGRGDLNAVNDIFCLSLRFSVGVSILFFIGCVFFPRPLMLIFTNEEALISIGCSYLKIAGWSYLLTGISQCHLATMKISEHASTAALVSSCTVVLNIILNAIFIFGLLGFPAMSVQGAATATLIARIVELAWCIIVSYKKSYIHPKFTRLFAHIPVLTKDFIHILWPLLGASMLWGVGFTSYSAFMGHLGTDAAAANSVSAVIRDLVCCFANGISAGGGILVGNELGAGKLDRGKEAGDRLLVISFVAGFACTAIMLLLTPLSMNFVKLTDGASYYLKGMMIIMAFYMIGRTANTVIINGIFAAGGDTLFDMYSLPVCMWGIAIPLAALGTFVFHWNPLLVYACTCLDEVGKIPWVLVHYKKYKWVKDLTKSV